MSTRPRRPVDGAEEYAWWFVAVAAAVLLVAALGLRLDLWQILALFVCVRAGRHAARINERRKAARAAEEHRLDCLHYETIDRAARAAFQADDAGQHVAGGWTWDSISVGGRENYRNLTRAIATALHPADPQ